MLRLALIVAASAAMGGVAYATPRVSVLINSAHGANEAVRAIAILEGSEVLGSRVVVDRTVCAPNDTTYDARFVADALSRTTPFYSVTANGGGYDCGPPPWSENYAPYGVLNRSFSNPPSEAQNYRTLEAHGIVLSVAYLGPATGPAYVQPGIYTVNTAGVNAGKPSGRGVEWAISAGYKGMTTDAASWVTADMTGILAAMRLDHPRWTVPDIVAALRQTASHWSTGYDASDWGYGIVNYVRADAIASTSSLYLEPPVMAVINNGCYATITLYPFRQTRRAREVVYSVSPSYVWPVKNEYTTADIEASGAALIYTSNGTDVTPTFEYAPPRSGTLTLIAFTTDGHGRYSRVESFSLQQVRLTVGPGCLR